jgi:hypothetical protein
MYVQGKQLNGNDKVDTVIIQFMGLTQFAPN